jgi:hypothetical protein
MRRKQIKESILPRQLVVLTALFLLLAGVFGVATVGLRQEIATSGAEARRMESRLAEIERFMGKYTGEIAIAMSPGHLEAQNRALQLGLRPPLEEQVVRVNVETQLRFAQQRWQQVVEAPVERISFYVPRNN